MNKQSRERARFAAVASTLALMANCFPSVVWALDTSAAPAPPTVSNAASATNKMSSLSVLSGNQFVLDVSKAGIQKVTGDVTNGGTIYVVSTNPYVHNAFLSARDIMNFKGATITTMLPAGGLPGFDNALTNLSLSLFATRNIVNYGTISSAASLSMQAGGKVINQTGAVAQAVNNINILSSNVANHGLIASQLGNVNISSVIVNTVVPRPVIDNASGLIQALNGSINIGNDLYKRTAVLTVNGGTLDAPVVNLNAGLGTIRGYVNDVTGVLNVSAGNVHFGTGSDVLTLGSLKVTGDPVFFNNNGNVDIQSDISFPENLAIIASGDITASLGPVTISTRDFDGKAHDVVLIAGAQVGPTTGVPTANVTQNTAPFNGGLIRVIGASLTGGNIQLNGSTVDVRSAGNNDGGSVTLVAWADALTHIFNGGIQNVNILAGGSGTKANGSVTVLADGRIPFTNNAIDSVAIDSVGGAGTAPALVNLLAAPITASNVSFNNNGVMSGKFVAGFNPRNADILINAPITVDGGNVTASTAGSVVISSLLSTAGVLPGRSGGDIKITANSIDVSNIIDASGSAGAPGNTGLPGQIGFGGDNGGAGGDITLKGATGININANILSNGGTGGFGGQGGDGAGAGKSGGAGGGGGVGGRAGSLSLTTSSAPITQVGGVVISLIGGTGGNGGNGGVPGVGSGGLLKPLGGNGGAGGSAGVAGAGGSFKTLTGAGDQNLLGTINVRGGDGGFGGDGQDGVSGASKSGNGGKSGAGSDGGSAGMISLSNTTGNMVVNILDASGGIGGGAGAAGNGAPGTYAGDGGFVNSGGDGGDAGRITLLSFAGSMSFNGPISLNGGNGADQTNVGGSGALGVKTGGDGGNILEAGKGGMGGSLRAETTTAITVSALIDASGGLGGTINAIGGMGADGNIGGSGGFLGSSGDGGKGGSITLKTDAPVQVTASLKTSGGNAGGTFGSAGNGGDGLATKAGLGGDVKSSGKGGMSGDISITSKGLVDVTADLFAIGGDGGKIGANAGNSGDGVGKAIAIKGGSAFDAGDGGKGGRISIEAGGDITTFNIIANGGKGGDQAARGGFGGTGKSGGDGGGAGNSGGGGFGGTIDLKTTQTGPNGLILVDHLFTAFGGQGGAYEAAGGDGGNGTAGSGGDGGALGNQGSGNTGGSIFLTGYKLTLVPTGRLYAEGGSLFGFETSHNSSGNGGNGGGNTGQTPGGNGGSVGFSGSGGRGGMIKIDMGSDISLDNGSTDGSITFDSISTRGGSHFFAQTARSGHGGDAGMGAGKGGDGGKIKGFGSAGEGGKIEMKSATGSITGPSTFANIAAAGGFISEVSPISGYGGNAGLDPTDSKGKGGDGGGIGNNGNGGNGGTITLETTSGLILIWPLVAVGGDVGFLGAWNPSSGHGGNGGAASGQGGNGGDIGANGRAGNGGGIGLTSTSGVIGSDNDVSSPWLVYGGAIGENGPFGSHPSTPTTGYGGNATFGDGGSSGSILGNGTGGNGGKVIIHSGSGDIFTPKGSLGASGGDGGIYNATTGNGGNVSLLGDGGKSGSIGGNSSGGNPGYVEIISDSGNITIGGVVKNSGGSANGNSSVTGNGGNSINGAGGKSGDIGLGGSGQNGGKVIIHTAGDFNMLEGIFAEGGNATMHLYNPRTGNGGDSLGGNSAGGDSGTISAAGAAGRGGYIEVKVTGTTIGGTMDIDRLRVEGGVAGNNDQNPLAPHVYNTPMQGTTGNGGQGQAKGGNAGRVGDAAKGGHGGDIVLYAEQSIDGASEWRADGGWGGDQQGHGGDGGNSLSKGGNGGAVGNAGAGNDGGKITVEVNKGPKLWFRDIASAGGYGGANTGIGGRGGDASAANGIAGAGGAVGDGGNGGSAGSAELTLKNPLKLVSVEIRDYADDLIDPITGEVLLFHFLDMRGGNGGGNAGRGGFGGNGTIGGDDDAKGGDGGDVGATGSGGKGGGLKFSVTKGTLVLNDSLMDGGSSGRQNAIGGDGGLGNGALKGGAGGDIGKQGDGGDGGSLEFAGGRITIQVKSNSSPPSQPPVLISANGGMGSIYAAATGNGGDGGTGGTGGKAGGAGGGGVAGKIVLKPEKSASIEQALITLNGGDRAEIDIVTGNGGMGGVGGQNLRAGDGGAIDPAGSAGGGGSLQVSSLGGGIDFTVDTTVQANGGSTFGTLMRTGNGGSCTLVGGGGNGGDAGAGPGAGGGGSISISVQGAINIPNGLEARGGSVGYFSVQTGDGGNSGTQAASGGIGGGNGGTAAGNGAAGGGGMISLDNTIAPGIVPPPAATDINVTNIDASGGSVGDLVGQAGNGGNGPTTKGAKLPGGNGGNMKDNGRAGDGGSISISTDGALNTSTPGPFTWNTNGGSVGDYVGKGGSGGKGSPAKISGQYGGTGGIGGIAGSNGSAGGGGLISLLGSNGTFSINGTVTANGGSVGTYRGIGGNGGDGDEGGGAGGISGANGAAGKGGLIGIDTSTGAITTNLLSATAGTVGDQIGRGGVGGNGFKSAGVSGDAGDGGTGNAGGIIIIHSKTGAINIVGDALANGSAGGDVHSQELDGIASLRKGGKGGSVGAAGDGGAGGLIKVTAESGSITMAGLVSANHGAGGIQAGKAGVGGNATLSVQDAPKDVAAGIGGAGGDVGKSGAAGVIGNAGANSAKIELSAGNVLTLQGNVSANGANGGDSTGKAGNGGDGVRAGGNGGALSGTGAGADGGTIKLQYTSITQDPGVTITANGGKGGDQNNPANKANGGNASINVKGSVGGVGGNVLATGKGGNGGTIQTSTVIPIPIPTFGTGGLQMPGPPGGLGGTGQTQGKNGAWEPAGIDGIPGTVGPITWDDEDEAQKPSVKKRKPNATLLTLDSNIKYADCVDGAEVAASKREAHYQPIAFVEPMAPSMVARAEAVLTGKSKFYAPSEPVSVPTAHGTVEIPAGAKVIVIADEGITIVRTLHDQKQGAVRFVDGERSVVVNIGKELVITDDLASSMSGLDASCKAAVRDTKAIKWSKGVDAYISDVSVASCLKNDPVLKAFAHSTNKVERKHYEQIAKNAAILFTLGVKKGAYRMQ